MEHINGNALYANDKSFVHELTKELGHEGGGPLALGRATQGDQQLAHERLPAPGPGIGGCVPRSE